MGTGFGDLLFVIVSAFQGAGWSHSIHVFLVFNRSRQSTKIRVRLSLSRSNQALVTAHIEPATQRSQISVI